MGFKSFLSAVGHDIGIGVKDVFAFVGSKQGQAIIQTGEVLAEGVATGVNPALGVAVTGGLNLVNIGIQKALEVEAGAAAVGAQSGTGAQKGAAVTAYLGSQSSAFLQSVGVSKPTSDQVQAFSSLIANFAAAFLNAIPAPTPPTPVAVPAPSGLTVSAPAA